MGIYDQLNRDLRKREAELKQACAKRYAAGLEAAARRVERWPYGSATEYTRLQNIAADIRALGKED